VNGLNNSDKADSKYSQSLLMTWRSKVKVTFWFKYLVAKATTLMLGH